MNTLRLAVAGFASAAALTLLAPAAFADECASDADCPVGFACEELGWQSCPGMPPCPEGEDCPPPPPCEDGAEWACVPVETPCEVDADCGPGLACLHFTYEECYGEAPTPDTPDMPGDGDTPTPDPDGGDDEPDHDGPGDDFECRTVTESVCAPPYVGECDADADCGPGFTCVAAEDCACSGGGSIPPDRGEDSGDTPPPLPEDDCVCEPSDTHYCEPVVTDCATDADCLEGWTCEDAPSVAEVCYEDESGEVICEREVSESNPTCAPPGWDAWGGSNGDWSAEEPAPNRGETEDDGGTGAPVSAPRLSADEDGCNAAPRRAGFAWGLAALGLALVRRRR